MIWSSAGSALVIENGLASGGGPSPRICATAGPPRACAAPAATATAITATPTATDQNSDCFIWHLDNGLAAAAGGCRPRQTIAETHPRSSTAPLRYSPSRTSTRAPGWRVEGRRYALAVYVGT